MISYAHMANTTNPFIMYDLVAELDFVLQPHWNPIYYCNGLHDFVVTFPRVIKDSKNKTIDLLKSYLF